MFKMTEKKVYIISIIALLISLLSTIYYYTVKIDHLKENLSMIESEYYDYKNGQMTYTNVNMDKEIEVLKKENRELYDSIKSFKNEISFLTQFKYKKTYITDTIYVYDQPIDDKINEYTYSNETDTISYRLNIGSSNEPSWYKLSFSISDKLTLVNRKDDTTGLNKTTISSSDNAEISDVSLINTNLETRKNKHYHHGISAGIGYGLINRKPDVYIGYSVTLDL